MVEKMIHIADAVDELERIYSGITMANVDAANETEQIHSGITMANVDAVNETEQIYSGITMANVDALDEFEQLYIGITLANDEPESYDNITIEPKYLGLSIEADDGSDPVTLDRTMVVRRFERLGLDDLARAVEDVEEVFNEIADRRVKPTKDPQSDEEWLAALTDENVLYSIYGIFLNKYQLWAQVDASDAFPQFMRFLKRRGYQSVMDMALS